MEDRISLLKEARLRLLALHKSLVDLERAEYEKLIGALSSAQYVNMLLNDERFAWLRKFSMLIVEIDETFDLDEGITEEMIDARLAKMRDLIGLKDADENFLARYQSTLQNDLDILGKHTDLKKLLR